MRVQFHLPDLGEGITEAEVVRWLVKPGAQVALDQEIVEVQTDKALVVLPSPYTGIVSALHVKEGQSVPVHTALLTFDEQPAATGAERVVPAENAEKIGKVEKAENTSTVALAGLPSAVATPNGIERTNGHVASARHTEARSMTEAPRVHLLATPVARRMARELGVDIATVQGTGPAGRIRTADIQRAATQSSAMPPTVSARTVETGATAVPQRGIRRAEEVADTGRRGLETALVEEERIPLRGLRKRIAENMVRSAQTIPQVTSCIEVNASELVALRTQLQPEAERQGVKLSYLPFIMKAVVQALVRYPVCNAMLDEKRNEIVLKHVYHLGIATATPDGLLVPVIRHVDRLTLLEVARELQRVSEQARARTLPLHELRGSTFTLTNYGAVGGYFSNPLINPGEAAILGLGKIEKRPWVVADQLAVCPVLPLSLTVDHRLIDGEEALRFLHTIIEFLEQPQRLLLHMR
jgi:Pyruvate/2-oxoglutarate dehydrogenase complex, dihydrolipoamide acyltransferase (E2) component, and related enzymes